VEIVAIQPPGREDRIDEPPFTDAPPLIRQIVQVMRPYLQAPFALYGHSGGALTAFEVARALQARYRRTPVHLFVSGQPAPDTTEAVQRLGHLEDAAFVEAIHGLGGTSAAVTQDPQLLEILVPTLRADFTMWERYTFEPGAPLDCPITAFGGTADPRAPLATIDAWRRHTGGVFSLRLFEGNHFFTGDNLAELTSEITAALL
jgi:medium-chain acyl-[acyl-carrier-protein] hydrolase